MKEGHIFTEGPITPDYPEQIAAQIARVGEVDKYIHHVSSPGGDVIAGYKGYHKLVALAKPIDSIVEGEAQSMGSFIIMASCATGGKIKILNPSRVMIHNPKFKVDGLSNAGFADSDSLQSGADELRTIEQEMAEVYANATKLRGKEKSVDEIKAMMKKETFMSAQDAVALGFADEVIRMVNREENSKLKAVALGLTGAMSMEKQKGILARLGEMLIKADSSQTPTAVDVPVKGGGMLQIEGDAVQPGVKAVFDGKPAEGEYTLEDGKVVKCVGGVIDSVKEAPPQETEAQKLARENEQLKAQLAQKAKAEEEAKAAEQKAAAEAEAKAKAADEAKHLADTLAKVESELQAIKKQTVGSTDQFVGTDGNRAVAIGGKFGWDKKAVYASRTWLADNMPHLERHYPGGKFSDGTSFFDYRSGGPMAVSILETNFTYTWQGQLTTDLFFRPYLNNPALSDFFTIDTGSKDKKRYNIVPTLDKVLRPYTGCDQAVTGTSLDITDKYIQLKNFRMKEKWCLDDFTNKLTGSFNHLAQEWTKDGNAAFDPAGTPIDKIIMQSLKEALQRDVTRRVLLGDSDSSSVHWNQINGLITTLIDQSGASNYCVYRYGSGLGTGTLSDGTANTYLTGMWENSNILLKEQGIDSGKAHFMVTRSIWDNYYKYLVGVGAVTEQQYDNYVKGLSTLYFRGIPVKAYGLLDSFLADSTCPLYSTTRHIAILSMKENHILGVENTSDLGAIKSWFSDDDNVRYYSSQMTFGVLAPIHCDLTTISY